MRREWNLVREILVKVGSGEPLAYGEYDNKLNYHIRLLLENHIQLVGSGLFLTPRGRELFTAIQDERVFNNAMATLQSHNFGVTEDLLIALNKKRFSWT